MQTPAAEPEPEGVCWVKSSLSFANGNCVEIADLGDGSIGVRNSRDPGELFLRFTPEEWRAFLGGARNGEFDRFGYTLPPAGPREHDPEDRRERESAGASADSAGPVVTEVGGGGRQRTSGKRP
jgi:hypothetical protein